MNKWPYFSHNYFAYNCDFLLLGSKQDREPWVSFYGQMYSYLRNEYTVFCPQALWLNYIKKLNLISRLQGDRRNKFFLISNRIEHIRFLDEAAPRLGANTILFERAAQFSIKCGAKDMEDIVGNKMPGLGVKNNFLSPAGYRNALSKIFILIANNSVDDRIFLRNLAGAERDFMTFSPADTNSLYVESFIPLFGNNDTAKSWHFYLNIFERGAWSRKTSRPFSSLRPAGLRVAPATSTGAAKVFRLAASRLHKASTDPLHTRRLRERAPRILRAFSRVNKKFLGHSAASYKYDVNMGVFRAKRPFPISAPAADLLEDVYV